MAEQLTPYSELAEVIDALPLLLREARRARGLSQRAAAQELGFTFSTVSRLETGHDVVLSHAVTVLHWLDTRPHTDDEQPPTPRPAKEIDHG